MLKKRLTMLVAAVLVLLPAGSICFGESVSENFENVPLQTYSAVLSQEDSTVVNTTNINLNSDWKTNSTMGWDGKAYVGIVNGITGSNGRCLAISSRAAWSDFSLYPGVIYQSSKATSDQMQRLSFKFMTTDHGGGGIRFMKNGSNFYELIFPREGDSQLRVILNKSKAGERTRLFELPICTTSRRAAGKWYDIVIEASPMGEISWTVLRSDGTVIPEEGTLSGSCVDNEPFESEKDVTIEFISGGWRERCAYFDDLIFDSESVELIEEFSFIDSFENDDRSVKGINAKTNDNFSAFSRGMGHDGKAIHGIGSNINGVSSSASAMDGKFMYLESRSEDLDYSHLPALIYNGEYPKSRGYSVNVDVKPVLYNRGTGLRFCISDDQREYYELYFPGVHNTNKTELYNTVLSKIYMDENGVLKREILHSRQSSSSSQCIQGGIIYTMSISVTNGNINYSIKPKNGGAGFRAEGTVFDENNQLKGGKVAVLAGGNGNNYVVFDNFHIKSYDLFTDGKAEPDNIIYRELSYSSSSENVLDLGDSFRIRRINAENGTNVWLSKNGTYFVNVGTVSGGKLINTLTNTKYRYIKLTNINNVRVYTDFEDIAYLPLNARIKYLARFKGVDGTECTSSNQTALKTDNGVISAAEEYAGNIILGNGIYEQIFRIDKPYKVDIVHEQMVTEIYADSSVSITNPVAVVRHFDSQGQVIYTETVAASFDNGVIKFTSAYKAASAETSVIIKDGAMSMHSPIDEIIIK